MVTHGLVSPALLAYYPRKTAEELGLTQAQGTKLRKVTEGGIAITGIPIGFGIGLIAATGVEVAGTRVPRGGSEQRDGCSCSGSEQCVECRSGSFLPNLTRLHATLTAPSRFHRLHHPFNFTNPRTNQLPQVHFPPYFHPTPRHLHRIPQTSEILQVSWLEALSRVVTTVSEL